MQSLDGMLRVLPCYGRVALSPVRFFSADAANLDLISSIAPAQEGDTCLVISARGGWRVGIIPGGRRRQQRSSLLRSVVSPKRDGAVKTPREKAEEPRQLKLDLVREQIQIGTLVIRQMTDEERRRYPPQTTQSEQPRRRYR